MCARTLVLICIVLVGGALVINDDFGHEQTRGLHGSKDLHPNPHRLKNIVPGTKSDPSTIGRSDSDPSVMEKCQPGSNQLRPGAKDDCYTAED